MNDRRHTLPLADEYIAKLNPLYFLRPDAAMTRPLDFDEIRIANQNRFPDFNNFTPDKDEHNWTVNDWAVAAAGEMGEMCNLLKKLRRGEDISLTDIGREMADTICYLDFVAWKLGLDLSEEYVRKFNEVSERVGSSVRL